METELLEYIQNGLKQGLSEEKLKSALLMKGWSKEQIEQAFQTANLPQDQPDGNRLFKNKTLILAAINKLPRTDSPRFSL